ncbi:MAG: SUMF1/EgtB/PvdO family nonheme iron enzyme [Sphingobacteriales bacterium]|nr:MAG: SUMF1/EgtB/PvdO family nonheme iron enzyme [Sphingobacteriales bacterium]
MFSNIFLIAKQEPMKPLIYQYFLIPVLCCCYFTLSAQNTKFAGCSFDGSEINVAEVCDMLGFRDAHEAETYIDQMLDLIGVKRNFQVFQCNNINNCAATTLNVGGMTVPALIYDNNFLSRLNTYSFTTVSLNNNPKTDWPALAVLAHEIGHLLNFHILQPGGSRPEIELEADEFAGGMIYKMGGNLTDAQKVYYSNVISESGGGTHPPRFQRLMAVKKGFDQAQRLNPRNTTVIVPVPEPEPPVLDLPNLPEMVFVKGGTFTMGDTFAEGEGDELPTHQVTLSDFYIGKYEVTFEEYDLFCEETNRSKPFDEGWGRGKRPVINVNWEDAMDYCEWASKVSGKKYSLPTEAQWEYASRSRGEKVRFANGKDILNPIEANFKGDSEFMKQSVQGDFKGKTMPVGSFTGNALGLFDFTGNVWEWCADWYDYDFYGKSTQNNPVNTTQTDYRVLRGCSWNASPSYGRAANRNRTFPSIRDDETGFRVVITQ